MNAPLVEPLPTAITGTAIAGQYWTWLGYSVYYVKAGEAKERPPLLLIHGFGASTDHWQKNLAGLQDEFEVWAIDLLGFGRSEKPVLPDGLAYDPSLWCQQLTTFVQEVIGRPAVLVGNSIGGYMALSAAAEAPDKAAGLVLLNAAGGFTTLNPVEASPWQKFVQKTAGFVMGQPIATLPIFLYLRNRATIRKTLTKVYFEASAITDELVENIYRPAFDKGAYGVFASMFSAPKGKKVDVLLAQLQCPLLQLWGEKDPWINARDRSAKFREHYAAMDEEFLEAGHCPHDEVPDQVNQHLKDWVVAKCSP
jgi:pimeloyl-ACP methyl ester carboxylesterase